MKALYNVQVRTAHLVWADSPSEAIKAGHAIVRLTGLDPLPSVADDAFVSEPVESMHWDGERRTVLRVVSTGHGFTVPFNVRPVFEGDRYGLGRSLVHDGTWFTTDRDETGAVRPMVEFYDARYEHDPRFDLHLGQFVSRYYVDTLLDRVPGTGLCLDGGVPAWVVDGSSMDAVCTWLREEWNL